VAISKTKLSEFKPGAANDIGFVPKAAFFDLVGKTIGLAFVKLKPCYNE
jgi:hypothetical protein